MTASSELLQAIVLLIWACLEVPGSQNKLFAELFFAVEVVSSLVAAASLEFAPGLLDALQSAAPPSVDWFKHLPARHLGRWGVYVLVFELDGMTPHLYCGSASEVKRGVTSRWALYDKHNLYLRDNTEGLPSGVIKAFKAGMKITHKGLLVSAPIPAAALVPAYRLLFYAMEATFSFAFWMMDSRKHYLYHSCCRWSLESFTYLGLCTHSALYDPIAGRFDLSSEQLTALDVDVKEKQRLHQAAYRRARLAADPEGYREQQRQYHRTYNIVSHDKAIDKQRRYTANHKNDFWCELCEQGCSKQYEWDRHLKSKNHLSRQAKADASIDLPYRCDICGHSCKKPSQLRMHCQGKRHKLRVAALAGAASSST